jgi:hypothetical protein
MLHYNGKQKKNLSLFIIFLGCTIRFQGCGASVASAAEPFKKYILISFDCYVTLILDVCYEPEKLN